MDQKAEQGTLFDERFLGRYAGSIMSDPTTALVELVANAWDAYATKVDIHWPDSSTRTLFQISDNGIGMTPAEFETRWRTLEYDRLSHQGGTVAPPSDLHGALPRKVYGRNGRGRHAAFLFSSPYRVRTWRDGIEAAYVVSQGGVTQPIHVSDPVIIQDVAGHGTEISAFSVIPSPLSADDARAILSTRFLMDPSFEVTVDSVKVSFDDIPADCIQVLDVPIEGLGTAKLVVIDSLRPDKTTKQHGIAWWVNRRLVGQGGWNVFDERIIDGRTEEAKRYTFIVFADFLAPAVLPDWSNFKAEDDSWRKAQAELSKTIRQTINGLTSERREKAKQSVRSKHLDAVEQLPLVERGRWEAFLDEVVEKCPSLSETQIDQVMGLLANLELSSSQYALIEKLHTLSPDELDDWNDILEEWSVATAKAALDEIAKRLKLIEELRVRTADEATQEVQDLQPLIGQSLWIFGPQFESIEFTSNRGMSTVIRDLMGGAEPGSLNRPDFVILPDGSVGFYSRPLFDEAFNEIGVASLVVVELKKPGVPIGSQEKGQAWKYIKELMSRGYVTDRTDVVAYVLGDRIEPGETGDRREGDRVIIRPLLYNSFIGQAEKRMMNLHRKLIDAPFMQAFLRELEERRQSAVGSQQALDLKQT
jgi:hypothetical protein